MGSSRRALALAAGLGFVGCSGPAPTEALTGGDPAASSEDPTAAADIEPIEAVETDRCPDDGWCWVQGPPVVTGIDGDRVYALGFRSTLLLWDEVGWARHTLPTASVLRSVLVSRPNDLWAVDDEGASYRFDGSVWSRVSEAPRLGGLRRAEDGSVWATHVRDGGHGTPVEATLFRHDDGAWRDVLPQLPYAFPGGLLPLRADEVWATGLVDFEGSVRHAVHVFRGEGWSQVGPLVEGYPWPASLQRVDGRIRHPEMGEWDGERWREPASPPEPAPGPTGPEVYELEARELGCPYWMTFDARHHFCPARGQVYFGDGAAWAPTLVDPFATSQPPERWGELPPSLWAGSDTWLAWGSAPDDVHRARMGASALERFDGERWQVVYDSGSPIVSIAGAGYRDVWFVDEDGRLHHDDGRGVERVAVAAETSLESVRALDDGSIVVASATRLFVRVGGRWEHRFTAQPRWAITSVAGTGRGDLYVVEEEGGRSNAIALHHDDGRGFEELEVEGLDAFARLTTHRGHVWMHSHGKVRDLGGDVWLATPERSFSRIWLSDDAIWLLGPRRAARHPLP